MSVSHAASWQTRFDSATQSKRLTGRHGSGGRAPRRSASRACSKDGGSPCARDRGCGCSTGGRRCSRLKQSRAILQLEATCRDRRFIKAQARPIGVVGRWQTSSTASIAATNAALCSCGNPEPLDSAALSISSSPSSRKPGRLLSRPPKVPQATLRTPSGNSWMTSPLMPIDLFSS